jgi:ferric-dicitrate binding protein FerR (iron transport regulator)
MMEEKIKAYKEDLKTVKDEIKQKIVDEYKSTKKEMRKIAKKFEVLTINAIMSIRGTQFLFYEDENKGTEVVVLEGGVELKSKNETRTVVVNEGYRAAVAKDGKLSEPEKIDISNLERWWEK